MALIQVGSLISNIKGSIGGVTFSNLAAGIAAKKRLSGKKSKTSKQLAALQKNVRLLKLWGLLSIDNKTLWNEYAILHPRVDRYGQTKTLTGLNWYQSINTALFYIDGSTVSVPPTYGLPDELPSFDVTFSTTDMFVNWSTPIDEDSVQLYIFSTPPVKSTSKFNRGAYRQHSITESGYSSVFSIASKWSEAHSLNWASITSNGFFNINVMIFAISKTSGITGFAVTSTNQFIF